MVRFKGYMAQCVAITCYFIHHPTKKYFFKNPRIYCCLYKIPSLRCTHVWACWIPL